MPDSVNSSLFIGVIIYQAIITIGLVGYLAYLTLAFSNYRNIVAKAFTELLKQDEELARRIQQIVNSFALMDALFPPSAQHKTPPPPPSKKKEPTPFKPLHNYSKDLPKDRSHLSVIETKAPSAPGREDPSNDKGD